MTNRQKVEALRDEIRHQHNEDECNQWSMDGFNRRLDAILADWPEETIVPEITQCQLCGRFHHSSETDYCVSMRGAA